MLAVFLLLVLMGFLMGSRVAGHALPGHSPAKRDPEPYVDPDGGYIEDEIWDPEDGVTRVPTVRGE